MGMFDKKNNFGKCTCPHCRGGCGYQAKPQPQDMTFNTAGQQHDITNEVSAIEIERLDPEDIVAQYLEEVLECESPEEVKDVLVEFFDEVFAHAIQEAWITDIESKILALNVMKEAMDEEYDDDDDDDY